MPQRSYKLRAYLTSEQTAAVERWSHHLRWVWNHSLRRRSLAYRRRQESVSAVDVSRALTKLKRLPRYAWVAEVPATCITQRLRDQDTAFQNFFAGRARYPRFRKRRTAQQRLSLRFQLDQRCVHRTCRPAEGHLQLPRLGNIRVVWSRIPVGVPKMVTLSRDAAGRWFVSMSVEEPIDPLPPCAGRIGIDRGLSSLMVDSHGHATENLRPLQRRQRRLKRAQRALSRKIKGSGRWHAQCRRVGTLHVRVADARRNMLHQTSRRVVNENQVIALEDLNVRGMMGNRRLARAIGDAGWHELHRQLDYKARWAGREVHVIDRWAPSSKVCSACGHKRTDMPLSVRTWDCPECGVSHDRDHNAAKNILDWALNGVPEQATARSAGSKARGGETTPRSGSEPIPAEVA